MPVNVQFFKILLRIMESKGHSYFLFSARNRSIIFLFADKNNISYYIEEKGRDSIIGMKILNNQGLVGSAGAILGQQEAKLRNILGLNLMALKESLISVINILNNFPIILISSFSSIV